MTSKASKKKQPYSFFMPLNSNIKKGMYIKNRGKRMNKSVQSWGGGYLVSARKIERVMGSNATFILTKRSHR